MIPKNLVKLIEKQPGNIHRKDKHAVAEALKELDIDFQSEISEFFLNYIITFLKANPQQRSYAT